MDFLTQRGGVTRPVSPDDPLPVTLATGSDPTGATVKGYQQITDVSAAVGLTVPSGAAYAIIQCESQAVRWRDDGTNPTAGVGMRLLTTGELYYDGDLSAIKFIQEAATAKLNVSYYA